MFKVYFEFIPDDGLNIFVLLVLNDLFDEMFGLSLCHTCWINIIFAILK